MTEQEERQQYYAQALESLSVIRRDVAWLVPAVARIEERDTATDRRLGVVEAWQSSKDDETTATGRHNIEKLQQQLAARDEAKAARKSTIIKWAAGVLGTVIGGSVLTWVGVAIAGCM